MSISDDLREAKLSDRAGDQTLAMALGIAERRLIELGWRYSDADVGKAAASIIAGLDITDAGRRAIAAAESTK